MEERFASLGRTPLSLNSGVPYWRQWVKPTDTAKERLAVILFTT